MTKLQKSIDNAIAAIDNCLELCEGLKKTLASYMVQNPDDPADEDMVREGPLEPTGDEDKDFTEGEGLPIKE